VGQKGNEKRQKCEEKILHDSFIKQKWNHLGTQVSKDAVVKLRLLFGQLRPCNGVIKIKDKVRHRLGHDIRICSHVTSLMCWAKEQSRQEGDTGRKTKVTVSTAVVSFNDDDGFLSWFEQGVGRRANVCQMYVIGFFHNHQ
jgi:hypothetical protein